MNMQKYIFFKLQLIYLFDSCQTMLVKASQLILISFFKVGR